MTVLGRKSVIPEILVLIVLVVFLVLGATRLLSPLSQISGTLERLVFEDPRFNGLPSYRTAIKLREFDNVFWTYSIPEDRLDLAKNVKLSADGRHVELNVHESDLRNNYSSVRTYGLKIDGVTLRSKKRDMVWLFLVAIALPIFLIFMLSRHLLRIGRDRLSKRGYS